MKHTLLAATFLAATQLALSPAQGWAQDAAPAPAAPASAAPADQSATGATKTIHHRRRHRRAVAQTPPADQSAAAAQPATPAETPAPAKPVQHASASPSSTLAVAAALAVGGGVARQAAVPAPAVGGLPVGAGPGLTPTGAIQAGNADGTIPAWTGGLKAPQSNRPVRYRPDPFAGERPLYTIDAQNVDRYSSKLAAGTIAMIRTLPGFHVDVYPTHRTFAAPQYIYDNAVANVTRAHAVHSGEGVEGAQLSIPFPIPHDGHEAIWNHILRWRGTQIVRNATNVMSSPAGDYQLQRWHEDIMLPYNTPGFNNSQKVDSMFRQEVLAPPRDAGALTLAISHEDPYEEARQAWSYNPGERRVRRAPDIDYDTPLTDTDGLETVDDYDMFNGALDRYEWTLVGRREVYVPYNTYHLQDPAIKYTDLIGKDAIKPDYIRWELHRVWVVEAKLRPEFRHIYTRRTFYLDEDSWQCLIADRYDGRGALWRTALAFPIEMAEVPVFVADGYEYVDLYQHRYLMQGLHNQEAYAPIFNATTLTTADYTAEALRRIGHR